MKTEIDLTKLPKGRIRLGEDLIILNLVYHLLNQGGYNAEILKKQEIINKMSNAYDMLKIESLEGLFEMIDQPNIGITGLKSEMNKSRIKYINEIEEVYDDFVLDINVFNFFNYYLWPKVLRVVFNFLSEENQRIKFSMQIIIPQTIIKEMNITNKDFLNQLEKYLIWNVLGTVKSAEDEDENLNIVIKVGC